MLLCSAQLHDLILMTSIQVTYHPQINAYQQPITLRT